MIPKKHVSIRSLLGAARGMILEKHVVLALLLFLVVSCQASNAAEAQQQPPPQRVPLTLEQVCEKHHIGHVHVLSLDAHNPNNTKVTEICRKLVQEYGLAPERLRLVDAVNGQALGDGELSKRVGGLLASFQNPSKHGKGLSRGEIGTALTHHAVWETIREEGLQEYKQCNGGGDNDDDDDSATRTYPSGLDASGPDYRAMVLEDDPTFLDDFVRNLDQSMAELQVVDPAFHWLYLSRRRLFPQHDRPTSQPHILRPAYSYWANAYILTARGASVLLRHGLLNAVIPVDEFVPLVTGSHFRLDWMRYFGIPVDAECRPERNAAKLRGEPPPVPPEPLGVCVTQHAPLTAYAVEPNLITQNFAYDADGHVISTNDNATDALQVLYGIKHDGAVARHETTFSEIVTFQTRGWVQLEGVLPELTDSHVQIQARKAHARTLRHYANYSIGFLTNRYSVDLTSDMHVTTCGPLDVMPLEEMPFGNALERLGPDEANELLTPLLKRLECSVKLENRVRGTKQAVENGPTLPYFQALNLHRLSPLLHRIATETSLGRIAASLLQSPKIRLYQTALFAKDATPALNRPTGWHRDLVLVPLDTKGGGLVTLWCPLDREIGLEDSSLVFASGSHLDVALEYWYPDVGNNIIAEMMRERYRVERAATLKIGDCTAHNGWIYHEAPKQPPELVEQGIYRRAVAFHFVSGNAMPLPDLEAQDIRKERPDRVFQREDEMSYEAWIHEVEPFVPIDHPLLPLVYTDEPIVIR